MVKLNKVVRNVRNVLSEASSQFESFVQDIFVLKNEFT